MVMNSLQTGVSITECPCSQMTGGKLEQRKHLTKDKQTKSIKIKLTEHKCDNASFQQGEASRHKMAEEVVPKVDEGLAKEEAPVEETRVALMVVGAREARM